MVKHTLLLVDGVSLPVDEVEAGVGSEQAHGSRYGAREQGVVGVNPRENVAARERERDVEPVCGALIRLEHDAGEVGTISLDYFATPVRGARVDDDVLEIAVILREDGLDSTRQESRLVERDGDDADSHWESSAPLCLTAADPLDAWA